MPSLSTKTLLLVLFLGILSLSDAKLWISSPDALVKDKRFNQVNGIDYVVLTPQNKITYKRSFRGNLILASPSDDACSSIEAIPSYGDNAVYNPIVVATWGECHYAQKVKSAEIAGAKMLILVLRHDMPLNHPSVRQLPMTSNIEVLAVSKKDGDVLIQVLKEAKEKPRTDPGSVIELAYSYDFEKNVNYAKNGGKAIIDYWFTSNDVTKMSYEFLDDLKGVLGDFGSSLVFNPHYVVWDNEAQGRGGYNTLDQRCVSGGRYCDPESEVENRLFGTDAVLESLRQICLRDLDKDQSNTNNVWWKYLNVFASECVDTDITVNGNCHEKAFRQAIIPDSIVERVNVCMRDSFGASNNENIASTFNDNSKLKVELTAKNELHVDHYPALYVNKERYGGSFRNRAQLTDFICSHFNQDMIPSICTTTINSDGQVVHTSTDTAVYLAIIFGSVVFMAIVLYCVRRGVKRDVMFRMNDEISHIVTQYKQFKDKSNSSNVDDDL